MLAVQDAGKSYEIARWSPLTMSVHDAVTLMPPSFRLPAIDAILYQRPGWIVGTTSPPFPG